MSVTHPWILLIALVALISRGQGADWPMFRGNPQLTGIAEGSLTEKPALLWSFKTGAAVKSSAAVIGDKVFVGSTDSNLYCLSLQTGKPIWSFKSDGPVEGSPLVLEGRVYFGTANTNVYALAADSGKVLWSRGLDDKILSSPTWVEGTNGTRQILVGGYDFRLHSFNPSTGSTNWSIETSNYINGTPAVGNGLTAFGGCDAIVHVVDAVRGIQVREIEVGAYIAASGALVDGILYVGHYENALVAVDLNAGKVLWTYKDRAFPYFSSPAVTSDRILVGGRDKRLHCIDRRSGNGVWTFATRGKVDSSPVVVGSQVVVGSDDGRLYGVGLADGKERWTYEIGQPVQSSPAVVAGRLVMGADDGTIYCLGSKPSSSP